MRHLTQAVEFSVLIRRDFPLLQPHCQMEAELLNLQYPDPSKIADTAVRLRWYRHRKALLQSQVAEFAGIHRRTYIHFEEGRDYYPVDKLEKIAQILEVDMVELMDEYNLFLYHNQGRQIRAKREAPGHDHRSVRQASGCPGWQASPLGKQSSPGQQGHLGAVLQMMGLHFYIPISSRPRPPPDKCQIQIY